MTLVALRSLMPLKYSRCFKKSSHITHAIELAVDERELERMMNEREREKNIYINPNLISTQTQNK